MGRGHPRRFRGSEAAARKPGFGRGTLRGSGGARARGGRRAVFARIARHGRLGADAPRLGGAPRGSDVGPRRDRGRQLGDGGGAGLGREAAGARAPPRGCAGGPRATQPASGDRGLAPADVGLVRHPPRRRLLGRSCRARTCGVAGGARRFGLRNLRRLRRARGGGAVGDGAWRVRYRLRDRQDPSRQAGHRRRDLCARGALRPHLLGLRRTSDAGGRAPLGLRGHAARCGPRALPAGSGDVEGCVRLPAPRGAHASLRRLRPWPHREALRPTERLGGAFRCHGEHL
mmetsp:Transcript_22112/g.63345  ORF Transcript_22112/g.63345 Transcript_22112/m.63345 type:complete len:287 (+) Transcript_22112:1915-2775(+)